LLFALCGLSGGRYCRFCLTGRMVYRGDALSGTWGLNLPQRKKRPAATGLFPIEAKCASFRQDFRTIPVAVPACDSRCLRKRRRR